LFFLKERMPATLPLDNDYGPHYLGTTAELTVAICKGNCSRSAGKTISLLLHREIEKNDMQHHACPKTEAPHSLRRAALLH
jgi:hypothetical protein